MFSYYLTHMLPKCMVKGKVTGKFEFLKVRFNIITVTTPLMDAASNQKIYVEGPDYLIKNA